MRIRTAFSRITRTEPATSSTVSPFIRSAVRYAAIWAGVAAPSMISRITPSASASESETRSTSLAIAALICALMSAISENFARGPSRPASGSIL
jgi:hypothetical protein